MFCIKIKTIDSNNKNRFSKCEYDREYYYKIEINVK